MNFFFFGITGSTPCGTNGLVNNFWKTISKRAPPPTKSSLSFSEKVSRTHTHPVTCAPYPRAADRLGTGRKFPGRVGLWAVISQKSLFRVPFQEIIRHDDPRRYNTLPPPSSCGGRFKSSYPAPTDPGRPSVAYPQCTRKATCQVFSTSCPRVVKVVRSPRNNTRTRDRRSITAFWRRAFVFYLKARALGCRRGFVFHSPKTDRIHRAESGTNPGLQTDSATCRNVPSSANAYRISGFTVYPVWLNRSPPFGLVENQTFADIRRETANRRVPFRFSANVNVRHSLNQGRP